MNNEVVTYDDLIEDQNLAAELEYLAEFPYSSRWEELIDQFGEAKLMSLGADL